MSVTPAYDGPEPSAVGQTAASEPMPSSARSAGQTSTGARDGAYQRLVSALKDHGCGPTVRGSARCPAHDDRNPSLSFHQDPEAPSVLLICHAGCPTVDVLEALGLQLRDLYDEPSTRKDKVRGVAEYRYVDEQGQLLFVKVRMEPKRFHQKRLVGGKWVYNLQGIRRVLYRLPEVIAAVAAGQRIWVVEGEKDADRLLELGEVATCNSEGAGTTAAPKWRPEYGDVLVGAHVVVVADRDEAGRAHAAAIVADLRGKAASVELREAATGNDVSDHLDAGRLLEELTLAEGNNACVTAMEVPNKARTLSFTRASDIKMRPVRWLWDQRLPLGSLALIAGREGTGKSTVSYQLLADVTRGRLPGQHLGTPKSVVVAATEDSWEHTIVPRLMAAGADLDRVLRVDVVTSEGSKGNLTLPHDNRALGELVEAEDVALVLLDPLMSRLDSKLNTHVDAEVRLALEPITAIADETRCAVVGIIHVNKGRGVDCLDRIMGSRAFPAVARSVLFVMKDPDNEQVRLLGTPKSNLGRTDTLPTLTFTIESAHVADTDEGPISTGKVAWTGEIASSIDEVLESAEAGWDSRTATAEAADWLVDYLTSLGGEAPSADVKAAGFKAGHSPDTLKRAMRAVKVVWSSQGFPRTTIWSLSSVKSGHRSEGSSGENTPNALTALTAPTDLQLEQSVQSEQSVRSPQCHSDSVPTLCEICGTPGWHLDGELYPYCDGCRAFGNRVHRDKPEGRNEAAG